MAQRLLRLLYRLGPPPGYYEPVASKACAEVIIDAGGGAGHLYQAARRHCNPSYYILLEIDPVLASRLERDATSEAIVADARRPPLRRRRGTLLVLNDALHHIEGWRSHICEILEPAECILIHDYNPATRKGRILAAIEKLLGFPAEFTTPRALTETLATCNYRINLVTGDNFAYTIHACRTTRKETTRS